MEKIPNTNGKKIRFVLSSNNCFQFLFLIAKQTPIPDTKNNKGILQIFSIDIGIHNEFNGLSLCMNPINTPQGWKPIPI